MSPILEPDANTHMIRLETPRLVLREHVPDDLLPLHAMLSDPAVTWYLPDMRRDDPGETEAYLRAVMRDDEASFRLRYNLMIVEKASGEAAGSVGLHVIDGGELGPTTAWAISCAGTCGTGATPPRPSARRWHTALPGTASG